MIDVQLDKLIASIQQMSMSIEPLIRFTHYIGIVLLQMLPRRDIICNRLCPSLFFLALLASYDVCPFAPPAFNLNLATLKPFWSM